MMKEERIKETAYDRIKDIFNTSIDNIIEEAIGLEDKDYVHLRRLKDGSNRTTSFLYPQVFYISKQITIYSNLPPL